MVLIQAIIASSIQNSFTLRIQDDTIGDYSSVTYELCSFSASDLEIPGGWGYFALSGEDYATSVYTLCSFSAPDTQIPGGWGYFALSGEDFASAVYELCSFSFPINELPSDRGYFSLSGEDFASAVYELCSFAVPETEFQLPSERGYYTLSGEDFASAVYELCSFAVPETEFQLPSERGYYTLSGEDFASAMYQLCSYSITEEQLASMYPLSVANINTFKTSIYGVSSDARQVLGLPGYELFTFSYWEVSSGGTWSTVPGYQNQDGYGYLSGGQPWYDASQTSLSARLIFGYGGRSYRTNSVYLKPYSDILDIPNLQLWLDASDPMTIVTTPDPLASLVYYTPEPAWEAQQSSKQITVSPTTVGDLGAGQFTIEFWVYKLAGGNVRLLQKRNPTTVGSGTWGIGVNTDGSGLYLSDMSSGGAKEEVVVVSSGTLPSNLTNRWAHVAFVRNASNSISVYVDGIFRNAGTSSRNFTNVWNMTVGFTTRSEGANGYISNLRIIVGNALYNSNFTPTFPLTLLPNTTFLGLTQNTTLTNYADPTTTFSGTTTFAVMASSVTSPNSKVDWIDKSPNALTATQTVKSNIPDIRSNVFGTLSGFQFNGSSNFLDLSVPISLSSSSATSFFVYRRQASGSFSAALGNKTTQNISTGLQWSDNRVYALEGYSNSKNNIGPTVMAVTKNPKVLYMGNNNAFIKQTDYGIAWGTSNAVVDGVGVYGGTRHNGAMGEIIYANCSLPDAELALVGNSLVTKWSV